MPHIIVEYSRDVADHIDVPDLLQALHERLAVAAEGVPRSRIKSRGVPASYAVVGDQDGHGHMVHVTLLLLAGRDVATRRAYADPLHALARSAVADVLPNCSVTLEVRDMDPDVYYT